MKGDNMNLKQALIQLTQSSEDMTADEYVFKTIELIKASIYAGQDNGFIMIKGATIDDFFISLFTVDLGQIK